MKYLYLVLLGLLAGISQTSAQRNFKPGYIVSLNGDTTKGLVDYKEWNQNPREITFKVTAQSAPQQYTTAKISAFGIDQIDHYKRYIGTITKGAVDLADLSSGIDSSYVIDSIFLRVVSGGKNITLYSYRDKIKTRFFIADGKSATPAELRRYVYLDNKQANRIREFNFYTQQLLALAIKYAPSNATLTARINEAPYRSADLKAVVLQLNDDTDNYKLNNTAGGSSQFFIGIGVNLANASFFGTERVNYIENIFTAKTSIQAVGPVIAGGINFYFNKNVKKLLFRAEVNLTMNKIKATYSGSYTDYINKVDREEELTFNQTNVAFNPQLVYNIYSTNNFKFFIAGGIQLNFSSFSNRHYYGQNTLNGKPENKQDNHILYRKMTTSVTAKTGVTLANKFDVYLGYGVPVMITEYPNYGIDMSFYRLGINYLISKK